MSILSQRKDAMNTISLKVPEPLAVRLKDAARQKGVSKSMLIRYALEAYLQTDGTERAEPALSQVADLVGMLSGPEDLSVNTDYLRYFER